MSEQESFRLVVVGARGRKTQTTQGQSHEKISATKLVIATSSDPEALNQICPRIGAENELNTNTWSEDLEHESGAVEQDFFFFSIQVYRHDGTAWVPCDDPRPWVNASSDNSFQRLMDFRQIILAHAVDKLQRKAA